MKKLESPLIANQTNYKHNKIINNFNFYLFKKFEVNIDLLTQIKRIVKEILKLF